MGTTRIVESWINETDGYNAEQLAMNLAFQGDFERLDYRWNVRCLAIKGHSFPEEATKQAHVLHWNCGRRDAKPWMPLEQRYWMHDHLWESPREVCSALQT